MAERRWSAAQQQALSASGTDVLVNAGAGSGKTSVLTEKVIRMVKDGVPVESLLVLTFTNAAAREMKDRIRKGLKAVPGMSEEAELVESSHIQTFDAFAYSLARKYSSVIGVSSSLQVIDQTVLEVQRRKTVDSIFLEEYERGEPDFLSMSAFYSAPKKSDKDLMDYVLSIDRASDLTMDKGLFLDELENGRFDQKTTEKAISERFLEIKDALLNLREASEGLEDEKDSEQIIAYVDQLLSIGSYDELYTALRTMPFPRKPRGQASDGKFRDQLKASFSKNFGKKDASYGTREEVTSIRMATSPFAHVLVRLVKEFQRRMDIYKSERARYSFGDIARMALWILDDEDARNEIRSSFSFILVDEYQDTSDLQEMVIKKLGNDNVFMVGDVKQSIYRFRNANCMIFQRKYERFSQGEGGQKIDMNDNFRSRPEVVNELNSYFSILMDKETNPIDFRGNHIANSGNLSYPVVSGAGGFTAIRYELPPSHRGEFEGTIIADDIIAKVSSGYLVKNEDRNGPSMRPCRFSDFAVLIDRSTEFPDYLKSFGKAMIPVFALADDPLSGSDVQYVVENLCRLLLLSLNGDYGEPYRHSLASLMRSFLFSYPDSDIAHYLDPATKLDNPISKLFEARKESLRFMSLRETLAELLSMVSFFERLFALGDVRINLHRADSLLGIASSMDSIGMELGDLCSFFDNIADFDIQIETPPILDSENSVKLMTIHKSKGLEFPIVYFAGLYKKFNNSAQKSGFIVDQDYGLVMTSPIGTKGGKSLFKHLSNLHEEREGYEEKLRLLYVAMSRVKEKGILLYPVNEEGKLPVLDTRKASSFSEMLFANNLGFNGETTVQPNGLAIQNAPSSDDGTSLLVSSIRMDARVLSRTRASKTERESGTETLEFGTRLHRALELSDFVSKDTSFIENPSLRRLVDNVLNCGLFDDVEGKKVIHEYPYSDPQSGSKGFIDLLLVKGNDIDVIDFKSSGIDDPEYDRQLNKYREFLQTVSKGRIQCYLISAAHGTLREVN